MPTPRTKRPVPKRPSRLSSFLLSPSTHVSLGAAISVIIGIVVATEFLLAPIRERLDHLDQEVAEVARHAGSASERIAACESRVDIMRDEQGKRGSSDTVNDKFLTERLDRIRTDVTTVLLELAKLSERVARTEATIANMEQQLLAHSLGKGLGPTLRKGNGG